LNSSVSSIADLLVCLFVFAGGLLIIIYAARKLNISQSFAMFLYCWHTVFCYAYVVFVVANGGDASFYYEQSQLNAIEFALGTTAITYITRPFSYYLEFSFLATNFVFNILGAVGLLYLYAALKFAAQDKAKSYKSLIVFMILLPSCSFWSSAIGKDSLAFLSISMVVWAMRDARTRIFTLSIAILLMAMVRVHIAALMIVAFAISGLVQSQKISFSAMVALIASAVTAILLLPIALSYAGLDLNSMQDLSDYVDKRQSYNQEGGGGVDISQLSLPVQMFTYLLRPTLIEAKSAFQFIAALENTFLAWLIFLGGKYFFQKRKFFSRRWFYTAYAFMSWILLAATTANLGIASRQKWMIMPVIFMMVISAAPTVERAREIFYKHTAVRRKPNI
jgi:hypothetical protein